MNPFLKTLIIMIMVFRLRTIGYDFVEEACTKYVPGGHIIKIQSKGEASTPIKYDMVESFQKGENLGKGSFGDVKIGKIGINFSGFKSKFLYPTIKQIKLEKFSASEVFMLEHFDDKSVCPQFYACVYDDTHAYIMMAKKGVSFQDKSIYTLIEGQSWSESLQLYYKMIEKLAFMWDTKGVDPITNKPWTAGFVHDDIKPQNIVTEYEFSSLKLIDFGLARDKNSNRSKGGTPGFRSPGKLIRKGTYEPKDDLYSLAISIGLWESNNDRNKVFGFRDEYNRLGKIEKECYSNYYTDCHESYILNMIEILQKAKYGTYIPNFVNYSYIEKLESLGRINFTTLIAWIIYYKDFNLSYEEVKTLMETLIEKYKNKQEKNRAKKEAKAIEKKRVEKENEKAKEKLLELPLIVQKNAPQKLAIFEKELVELSIVENHVFILIKYLEEDIDKISNIKKQTEAENIKLNFEKFYLEKILRFQKNRDQDLSIIFYEMIEKNIRHIKIDKKDQKKFILDFWLKIEVLNLYNKALQNPFAEIGILEKLKFISEFGFEGKPKNEIDPKLEESVRDMGEPLIDVQVGGKIKPENIKNKIFNNMNIFTKVATSGVIIKKEEQRKEEKEEDFLKSDVS